MFSDSDTSSVGFSSNWKQSRSSEDICVQTTETLTNDRVAQTKDNSTIGVQTEEEALTEATNSVSYNEDALAEFLSRVCPAVVSELDRVSRSNAFASYGLTDQESDAEVKQLATLTQFIQSPLEGNKVTSLSWSCTGSVVAVGLSHTLHSSWCSHQSQVVLYNVDRDIKKASLVLEVSSCVRSVSMHPYISSILAAGLFSGEVVVWDTARDGSESTLVNVGRTTHNDSVSQVCWTLGTGTTVTLASSALDGQLFLWKVSPKLMSHQVQERFAFDVSSVPPGITCFAFPHHKQDTFVVALEGGALLHCSTNAAKSIATGPGLEVTKNPTVSAFEQQPSSVVSIEFSPHQEDLFATASTDQAIRIYCLFQRTAQRVVWTSGSLVGVRWSPVWPSTLAGWGHSGPAVTLYNHLTGDTLTTFLPDNSDSKSPLSAVAFNTKSPKLMAVGNLEGTAHIWEIPLNVPSKSKHL